VEKLNFQILRRKYATKAYGEHMGTLKDVQKQLRHTRPNTTLENYVKDITDSVYSMAGAMYEEITGPAKKDIPALTSAAGGVQSRAIEHILNTQENVELASC
jgi:hypothetical protein